MAKTARNAALKDAAAATAGDAAEASDGSYSIAAKTAKGSGHVIGGRWTKEVRQCDNEFEYFMHRLGNHLHIIRLCFALCRKSNASKNSRPTANHPHHGPKLPSISPAARRNNAAKDSKRNIQ